MDKKKKNSDRVHESTLSEFQSKMGETEIIQTQDSITLKAPHITLTTL